MLENKEIDIEFEPKEKVVKQPIEISYEIYQTLICESQLNPDAIGDNGDSIGIAQFQQPTFDEFSKKYNLDLDINNTRDQLILMKMMFADGYAYRWTCWRELAQYTN